MPNQSDPAELARICRAQAKLTSDPDARAALLQMAKQYEREAAQNEPKNVMPGPRQ